jgi:hypothetical protein
MKLFRLLLIGAAVTAALLLVLVGIAFNSGFQTWVARKALASQPGFTATLGRIAVGFHRVQVEDLRLEQGGVVVVVPALDVELSVVAAARQHVALQRLVAKGWTIDLTRMATPAVGTLPAVNPGQPAGSPPVVSARSSSRPVATLLPRFLAMVGVTDVLPVGAAEGTFKPETGSAGAAPQSNVDSKAAAATVFRGVLKRLKLPVDLAIESVDLEGTVVFPMTDGQPPVQARVTLTGGQLGTGREGNFDFTTFVALAPTTPVNALQAHGTLTAAMDTPRSFTRLAVQVDAEAAGPQLPQGARLTLAISAARTATGEDYTVQVEMVGKRLLFVQAALPEAGGRFSGSWKLDARDADVAPFALGHALPAFTASGEGRVVADPQIPEVQINGHLDATIDKLAAVRAELDGLGPLHVLADFDVSQLGGMTRIDRLSVNISGARPVFAAEALQGFEFNARTGEINVADPAKDLVHLTLHGLPLAWAQPFFPGLSITGNDVQGEFVASARSGGFALRPNAPLVVTDLSVSQAGRPLIKSVDLTLSAGADYSPQGWQVDVGEFTVRNGPTALLTATARAGRLAGQGQPVKAQGQWQADLPALLAQPVAQGLAALMSGSARGEFTASLDAKKEIYAKLTLGDLVAAPAGPTLPVVNATIRADVESDGKITFQAPLSFENTAKQRTSDLVLTGKLQRGKDVLTVDASVTSQFVAAEDLQLLAAVMAAKGGDQGAAVPPPAGSAKPDAVPAWKGVTGQMTFALKKVVYNEQFTMSEIGGTVKIDGGALKLEVGHAGLDQGGSLKFDGRVSFAPKQPEPYALEADSVVKDFDMARLFRALEPGKAPTLEGKFKLESQLTARGGSLPMLVGRLQGKTQVSSTGGIFRALRADLADKVQKSQSTVAVIGGLLGAVTGKEKLSDYANRTQNVTDIAQALAEIPFDQLHLTVTRDAQLNLRLQDFSLISPEVRLGGTGEIRAVDGVDLAKQPLDLRLQLGARGHLADQMNRVSLLDGKKDDLGYVGFVTPVHVGGTLSSPDTNELKAALVKAAAGSLLNSLLGK